MYVRQRFVHELFPFRKTSRGRQADHSRSGLSRTLRTCGKRSIAFDYDARRRIVRAYDSPTHSVSYSYDAGGRVSRVVASDGTIRAYTYNARDEMLTIDEPGWVIKTRSMTLDV